MENNLGIVLLESEGVSRDSWYVGILQEPTNQPTNLVAHLRRRAETGLACSVLFFSFSFFLYCSIPYDTGLPLRQFLVIHRKLVESVIHQDWTFRIHTEGS